MASTSRYGKPNMTNLPKDLGVRIFKTILATPTPDFKKILFAFFSYYMNLTLHPVW